MLINLQAFDVVVCQDDAAGGRDRQQANPSLRGQIAAKGMTSNHHSTGMSGQDK